jgi:hypothetical protein
MPFVAIRDGCGQLHEPNLLAQIRSSSPDARRYGASQPNAGIATLYKTRDEPTMESS